MPEKAITIKIPKIDIWRVLTILLALILLAQVAGFLNLSGLFALPAQSPSQIGEKVINYINQNLVDPGTTASLVSVQDRGSFYEIITSYQGNQISVYASKDGSYLFLQAYDLSRQPPTRQERRPRQEVQTTIGDFQVSRDEICKENGKPIVYFFGNEWCPHCKWEHPIVKNVTARFEGYISFHDNMDTDRDMDIFSRYSTGGIPTIVLGCRYYRVGSGQRIGQEQEAKVLTALICKLTGGKPENVCGEVQELISLIR